MKKAEEKRLWILEHADEIEAEKKAKEEQQRENDRINHRRNYETHKDEVNARSMAWYDEHREYVNDLRRQKRQSDPTLRISRSISRRINGSLHGRKSREHWEDLVGYTVEELKVHLESQFQPGMTWENYTFRGWHIDHIRPLSSFHYDSYNDPAFKECWALSNLGPLWAHDNLSKYNKVLQN